MSIDIRAITLFAALGVALPVVAQDAPTISEELTLPRAEVEVLGATMSYLEAGAGEVVLFVHGNPSSAYLWRNVMPHVAETHRAVAVDLIGMGRSDQPDIGYRFGDHAAYLAAFIEAMGFEQITLVGHDWGAALAWDYARANPDRVSGLAFMEGVLPPAFPTSYEALGEEMGGLFRALRDPVQGREMVMEQNLFVEGILVQMVLRPLGEAAMAEYRAPYATVESRLPTWMWPREVPIAGEPVESVAALQAIEAFMGETEMPVLLAYAEPGVLVPPAAVSFYTGLIDDIETAFVGRGLHFIQEDQPDAIGRAIADWLRRN